MSNVDILVTHLVQNICVCGRRNVGTLRKDSNPSSFIEGSLGPGSKIIP